MPDNVKHIKPEDVENADKAEGEADLHPRTVDIIGSNVVSRPPSGGGFGFLAVFIIWIIGAVVGAVAVFAYLSPGKSEAEEQLAAEQKRAGDAIARLADVSFIEVTRAMKLVGEDRNFGEAEEAAQIAKRCMSFFTGLSGDEGTLARKAVDTLDEALLSLRQNDATAIEQLEQAGRRIRSMGLSPSADLPKQPSVEEAAEGEQSASETAE